MKKILALLTILFALNVRAQTPNMEFAFLFGPSLSQSGGIQDMGDPNFHTAFEFNYYFNEKHGLGFFAGNEFDFEGTKKTPQVRDASAHTFDIHYAFRHRFQNTKWQLAFTPGFGIQTFYDESQDYYWGYFYYDDISTAWIVDYKIMLDYIVSEWNSGDNDFYFTIGGGIAQIFSLDDDYAGRDISGSRTSALLRLGLGF